MKSSSVLMGSNHNNIRSSPWSRTILVAWMTLLTKSTGSAIITIISEFFVLYFFVGYLKNKNIPTGSRKTALSTLDQSSCTFFVILKLFRTRKLFGQLYSQWANLVSKLRNWFWILYRGVEWVYLNCYFVIHNSKIDISFCVCMFERKSCLSNFYQILSIWFYAFFFTLLHFKGVETWLFSGIMSMNENMGIVREVWRSETRKNRMSELYIITLW